MELLESQANSSAAPARRRVHRSRAVLMMARLEVDMSDDLCLVCDISPMGARLKSSQDVSVGDIVRLDFGDKLEITGAVRWFEDGYCGIEFEGPVDLAPLFECSGLAEKDRQVFGRRAPGRSRRSHPRLRRCSHVVIRNGQGSIEADLFDVSPLGARLNVVDPVRFAIGDRVSFVIEDRFDGEGLVRWVSAQSVGIGFDPPLRIWKLEKWLLDGMELCGVCEAAECSAPSFGQAVANRKAGLLDAMGSIEPGQEGK